MLASFTIEGHIVLLRCGFDDRKEPVCIGLKRVETQYILRGEERNVLTATTTTEEVLCYY